VKWKWRLAGAALALATALAGGFFLYRSDQKRRQWEQAQVAAVLGGDAAAFENLRALGEPAVTLLEQFIQRHYRVEAAQIEKDVASLAGPEEGARRLALARLTLLPERASDLIKTNYDRLPNGEAKDRLKVWLANRARLQRQVAGLLTGLYSEHFQHLFLVRRSLLQKDCHHVPAQLFFAYAPFDQVWMRLKESPPEAQLRFLLLRLYAERDDNALECLERFPALEVLQAAAQTWWPVEIEPLVKEGGSGGTTRAAALEGKAAAHVLRLTLRPASAPAGPEEWATLDRWFRWTYVFRYKEPAQGREAVAYAEAESHRANQTGRPGPLPHREKTEGKFWLPEPATGDVTGPGHCEIVRHVPPAVKLPTVALSHQEAAHWLAGTAYEWARPLFAAAMQGHLRFQPNQFPAPQVTMDSDKATQGGGKKTRRTRR
jgi:hypothetical protein